MREDTCEQFVIELFVIELFELNSLLNYDFFDILAEYRK